MRELIESKSIDELQPGMRSFDFILCVDEECSKHDKNSRLLIPKNKRLNKSDIEYIKENKECIFKRQIRIKDPSDMDKYENDLFDQENLVFYVKWCETNTYESMEITSKKEFRMLKTKLINEKNRNPNTYLKIINHKEQNIRVEIIEGEEDIVTLNKFLRRFENCIKGLFDYDKGKAKRRNVMVPSEDEINRMREDFDYGKEYIDAIEDIIRAEKLESVFNMMMNIRNVFSKVQGSFRLTNIRNDSREIYYEDLWEHAYNVSIMAGKITLQHEPYNIFFEQVMTACLFFDIAMIICHDKNIDYRIHPKLAFLFYRLYYRTIKKIYPERFERQGDSIWLKLDGGVKVNVGYGASILLYHHERINGKGYPFGLGMVGDLQGFEMTEMCRLTQIVDAFLSLTEAMSFHEAGGAKRNLTPLFRVDAMKVIENDTDKKYFDKGAFEIFRKYTQLYVKHSKVQISLTFPNSDPPRIIYFSGFVTSLNDGKPLNPIVYIPKLKKTIDTSVITKEGAFFTVRSAKDHITKPELTSFLQGPYNHDPESENIFLKWILPDEKISCPICGEEIYQAYKEMKIYFKEFPEMNLKYRSCEQIELFLLCTNDHYCIATITPPNDCDESKCVKSKPPPCDSKKWRFVIEAYKI